MLAGYVRVLDREQRRAGRAIEQKHEAVLGGLRDGVDAAAVARHRHQARRRREVAIPDVVMDRLEVPDALAGRGVEREQRVREQVVAETIGAVEVGGRRSGRHVDDAARRRRRPCPAQLLAPPLYVHASVGQVSYAELARMRNRVERPAQRAGAHVDRRGCRRATRAGLR